MIPLPARRGGARDWSAPDNTVRAGPAPGRPGGHRRHARERAAALVVVAVARLVVVPVLRRDRPAPRPVLHPVDARVGRPGGRGAPGHRPPGHRSGPPGAPVGRPGPPDLPGRPSASSWCWCWPSRAGSPTSSACPTGEGVVLILMAAGIWILLSVDRGLLQAHRSYRAAGRQPADRGRGPRRRVVIVLVAAGLGVAGYALGVFVSEVVATVHAHWLARRAWADPATAPVVRDAGSARRRRRGARGDPGPAQAPGRRVGRLRRARAAGSPPERRRHPARAARPRQRRPVRGHLGGVQGTGVRRPGPRGLPAARGDHPVERGGPRHPPARGDPALPRRPRRRAAGHRRVRPPAVPDPGVLGQAQHGRTGLRPAGPGHDVPVVHRAGHQLPVRDRARGGSSSCWPPGPAWPSCW